MNISEIINKKIVEHQSEIDQCELRRQNIQAIIKDKELMLKEKLSLKELIQNSAALSYKFTFHKAAVDVLNDLLKEIGNEKEVKN